MTGTLKPNAFGISSLAWQPPEIRLELPPPPDTRDRGAIEASAAIVLGRNRKLRENLAVAQAANVSRRPAGAAAASNPPFAGEVLIRVTGMPEPPAGEWRRDLPGDAFAAMPLRRPVYPQFVPTSR